MGCTNSSGSDVLLTGTNPTGLPASKKLAVNINTGAVYYNDNGIWEPTAGASENLQQVTNLGNTTTNSIIVGNNLSILNSTSTHSGTFQTSNLTANRTLQLPDGNGPLVLTINGNPADSTGNINISANSAWGLAGNSGLTAYTNFLGTTDNTDLIFKRNNVISGILNSVSSNTAFGVGAFSTTSTATNITALGFSAFSSLTAGTNSVAIGTGALESIGTSNNNVAVGSLSMTSSTTSSNSVGVGFSTLKVNQGTSNNALGYESLIANTTGHNNLGAGASSLANLISGNSNTAIGDSTGSTLTTGSFNTLIGAGANISSSGTSEGIALGHGAVAASNQLSVAPAVTTFLMPGLPTSAGAVLTDVAGNGNLSLQHPTPGFIKFPFNQAVTAVTSITVSFSALANANYTVSLTDTSFTACNTRHYVAVKTTTSFEVIYVSPITGNVGYDVVIYP